MGRGLPELRETYPGREVRRRRGEDVAAVKGVRDGMEVEARSVSTTAPEMPPRVSAAETSRPLSGPTSSAPLSVRSASPRRPVPTPGSTTAR